MNIEVYPASRLKGSVDLPASKSYSIRAFLTAACGGRSVLTRPSDCDDAKVAMNAARVLGAFVKSENDVFFVYARSHAPDLRNFNVKESGTVLRLLLPLLPLYAKKTEVTGEGTLVGRPNRPLTETLRSCGIRIRGKGKDESVPVRFSGGTFKQTKFSVDGSLSSQFISALFLAAAHFENGSVIRITGRKIVSQDYLKMTRQVLAKAGVKVAQKNERVYTVKGGQTFKGLGRWVIPSDYGLAAFLLAAGSLTASDVTLKGNLDRHFVQADGAILRFLKRMGAGLTETGRGLKIKGPSGLKGGTFSLKSCPDLVPVMSVLALFAKGTTTLTDIGHVRAKESDRISDLRAELLKIGADVRETKDSLTIVPRKSYLIGQTLDSRKDHRLAMAFTVLGLKIGCRIKHIECVSKSYPGFVKDMRSVGARMVRR